MIAAGFENVNAEFFRDLMISLSALAGFCLLMKKLLFEKITRVKVEGQIATTDYVDHICEGLLTTEHFRAYEKHADRDRGEMRKSIEDAVDKIETFSSDNYKARRLLHARVNAHGNALYFMAGQHNRGDEIKRILDRAESLYTEADE